MFISSETIRIIRLVGKYQSITAAAGQINKVPSAISYTVKRLEETLGVELFRRKGCYIELTEAGEYFVSHSKSIMDDIDALTRNTALVYEGVEREMKVAVNNIVPQPVLVDFICAFERTFPSTQLSVNREVYNGSWDALYSKRADLVIGAPHAVPGSEDIVSESLGDLHWDFVVSPHHPLADYRKPLQTHDLRKYIAVCIRDTAISFNPQQAWLLDGQKPVFVPDFSTAIALIQQGVGIGYIPHHLAAKPIMAGELIKKDMQEHKHATHLFLAYRPDGMGKVRQWSVNYLLQSPVREQLCGLAD